MVLHEIGKLAALWALLPTAVYCIGPMPVLRTAAAVRALSPEEAAKAIPVHVEAIVTYYDNKNFTMFVRDASAPIYVDSDRPWPIVAGSRVIIDGVTDPGFTSTISKPHIREVGRGPRPHPRVSTLPDLLSGEFDCEYITASGMVRTAYITAEAESAFLELTLEHAGRTVLVQVLDYRGVDIDRLIGAEIRVTGAVGGNFNDRKQLFSVVVSVQAAQDIAITRAAPQNPYNLPLLQIGKMLRSSKGIMMGERTHARGTVTYVDSGRSLVIQDGSAGLVVKTRQTTPIQPGDEVDVTGILEFGDYSASLEWGNYRKTGRREDIAPISTRDKESLRGEFDSKLVSLDANLISKSHDGRRLILALQSGNLLLPAVLNQWTLPPEVVRIGDGSRLRITGVCFVETGGIFKGVRGYRLLLRTPHDIQVLRTPPWWSAQRLMYAIGALLAVVLATFGWSVVLRHRVAAQTREIRRVLAAEADRDKRFAAIQEARSHVLERINSREPLDGVLQSIAATVEQQFPGVSAYIHLLGEDGLLTLVGDSCSEPELSRRSFLLRPGLDEEVWSLAALERKQVSLEHPRPCCASPILSSSGELLGAISAFSDGLTLPEGSPKLLEMGAQLAALAIDNRRLYEGLKHRSLHDTLTGLPNRALFDERLDATLKAARRTGEYVAVVYIDLDEFKQVNDTHGHKTGDVFLRRAAERFRLSLRDKDTLARIGGDEFVAIAPGVRDRGEALEIVRRLRHGLDMPLPIGDAQHLRCSASIGMALFPEDGQSMDDLVRYADEVMYAAKTEGKNQALSPVR